MPKQWETFEAESIKLSKETVDQVPEDVAVEAKKLFAEILSAPAGNYRNLNKILEILNKIDVKYLPVLAVDMKELGSLNSLLKIAASTGNGGLMLALSLGCRNGEFSRDTSLVFNLYRDKIIKLSLRSLDVDTKKVKYDPFATKKDNSMDYFYETFARIGKSNVHNVFDFCFSIESLLASKTEYNEFVKDVISLGNKSWLRNNIAEVIIEEAKDRLASAHGIENIKATEEDRHIKTVFDISSVIAEEIEFIISNLSGEYYDACREFDNRSKLLTSIEWQNKRVVKLINTLVNSYITNKQGKVGEGILRIEAKEVTIAGKKVTYGSKKLKNYNLEGEQLTTDQVKKGEWISSLKEVTNTALERLRAQGLQFPTIDDSVAKLSSVSVISKESDVSLSANPRKIVVGSLSEEKSVSPVVTVSSIPKKAVPDLTEVKETRPGLPIATRAMVANGQPSGALPSSSLAKPSDARPNYSRTELDTARMLETRSNNALLQQYVSPQMLEFIANGDNAEILSRVCGQISHIQKSNQKFYDELKQSNAASEYYYSMVRSFNDVYIAACSVNSTFINPDKISGAAGVVGKSLNVIKMFTPFGSGVVGAIGKLLSHFDTRQQIQKLKLLSELFITTEEMCEVITGTVRQLILDKRYESAKFDSDFERVLKAIFDGKIKLEKTTLPDQRAEQITKMLIENIAGKTVDTKQKHADARFVSKLGIQRGSAEIISGVEFEGEDKESDLQLEARLRDLEKQNREFQKKLSQISMSDGKSSSVKDAETPGLDNVDGKTMLQVMQARTPEKAKEIVNAVVGDNVAALAAENISLRAEFEQHRGQNAEEIRDLRRLLADQRRRAAETVGGDNVTEFAGHVSVLQAQIEQLKSEHAAEMTHLRQALAERQRAGDKQCAVM